jgi:hypothetical protein
MGSTIRRWVDKARYRAQDCLESTQRCEAAAEKPKRS